MVGKEEAGSHRCFLGSTHMGWEVLRQRLPPSILASTLPSLSPSFLFFFFSSPSPSPFPSSLFLSLGPEIDQTQETDKLRSTQAVQLKLRHSRGASLVKFVLESSTNLLPQDPGKQDHFLAAGGPIPLCVGGWDWYKGS